MEDQRAWLALEAGGIQSKAGAVNSAFQHSHHFYTPCLIVVDLFAPALESNPFLHSTTET